MREVNLFRRYAWALFFASLMALMFVSLKAESDGQCNSYDEGDVEDCEALIYVPDRCSYLEPYGWWWFFFDCAHSGGSAGGGREAEAATPWSRQ